MSFITLPLHSPPPTSFYRWKSQTKAPKPLPLSLTMSQRCDGGKASSLVFLRSPGRPSSLFLTSQEASLNNSHAFVVAKQHTSQPGKRLFQEERGIYSNGPRRPPKVQPALRCQPTPPPLKLPPPPTPFALPTQFPPRFKKEGEVPFCWLAGTFH